MTAGGILGYIGLLILKIRCVADSVFVVAWVPDFALVLLSNCVGEAAF
jgi:hypothetical protein